MLLLTGLLVAWDSVVALAYVLIDGAPAFGTLAAAAFAGMWLAHLLGLGREPWRERFMLGAGLGIGTLSIVVLGLGALGGLRAGAIPLFAVVAVAALWRVGLDLRRGFPARRPTASPEDIAAARSPAEPGEGAAPSLSERPSGHAADLRARRQALALGGFHYLWLLAAPFLAVTLMAATLPPGILWAEEAWGYDVLEYHLAAPKEFFEAGRIFFMPYNVYSNLPLNSGMLFLLMMALRGDALDATISATLINVGLAVLFVAASWWAGRAYSRKAGVTAGVLAATAPWLGYLAGIAYVEPGMLAMGMLALGAMIRAVSGGPQAIRWALAAGLLAGFACGYKYTAVPLIAVPLAIVPLFAQAAWPHRLKLAAVCAAASVLAFSPWMIRNLVNTGNPLFPLAYSVFGARVGVWDAELEARWQHGHGWAGSGLRPDESILLAVIERTVLEPRVGLGLVLLAAFGTFRRRDRWTLVLLVVLVLQLVVWMWATHLFARFAVILLLPLILLAGRSVLELRNRLILAGVAAALVLGAGWNLYQFARLYYIHTRLEMAPMDGEGPTELVPVRAHGQIDWFVNGQWPGYSYLEIVNQLPAARVMFVGEARTYYVKPPRDYAVVFSRHPLAEAVRQLGGTASEGASPATYRAILRWLADRGVTHVLVHWLEMDRLRRTYGFDSELTPELFQELEAAGLARVGGGDLLLDDDTTVYATLYEVPHE